MPRISLLGTLSLVLAFALLPACTNNSPSGELLSVTRFGVYPGATTTVMTQYPPAGSPFANSTTSITQYHTTDDRQTVFNHYKQLATQNGWTGVPDVTDTGIVYTLSLDRGRDHLRIEFGTPDAATPAPASTETPCANPTQGPTCQPTASPSPTSKPGPTDFTVFANIY